jgi:hypothetical protein
MPVVKGIEHTAVVVVEPGKGKSPDKVRCIFCKCEFQATAFRIRKHLISGRNSGVGGCKGKPPKELIDRLLKEDAEKKQLANDKEVHDKLRRSLDAQFRQSDLASNFVSTTKKADADMALARFFFSEGIAFQKVESAHFKDMIQSISKAPGYTPPCRDRLSGPLLEAEYAATTNAVKQTLHLETEPVTMVSDGWKATNHELLAEDICKLSFVDLVIVKADRIAQMIRNHDLLRKELQDLGGTTIKTPGDTRFITNYIMLVSIHISYFIKS